MKRSARARLTGALGWAILLGACSSSPEPVLYTIAPVDGPVRSSSAKIVVIEQVQVAKYLERSQIVRSSEDYRVDLKSNDWWAESLTSMIRRVLQQELGQRLAPSVVLSETGAINASPDATIAVDVHRLDEDRGGKLILEAQASVNFKGRRAPAVQAFRIVVPAPGPNVTDEVSAVSTALGQLTDGIAATVAAGR